MFPAPDSLPGMSRVLWPPLDGANCPDSGRRMHLVWIGEASRNDHHQGVRQPPHTACAKRETTTSLYSLGSTRGMKSVGGWQSVSGLVHPLFSWSAGLCVCVCGTSRPCHTLHLLGGFFSGCTANLGNIRCRSRILLHLLLRLLPPPSSELRNFNSRNFLFSVHAQRRGLFFVGCGRRRNHGARPAAHTGVFIPYLLWLSRGMCPQRSEGAAGMTEKWRLVFSPVARRPDLIIMAQRLPVIYTYSAWHDVTRRDAD